MWRLTSHSFLSFSFVKHFCGTKISHALQKICLMYEYYSKDCLSGAHLFWICQDLYCTDRESINNSCQFTHLTSSINVFSKQNLCNFWKTCFTYVILNHNERNNSARGIMKCYQLKNCKQKKVLRNFAF